MRQRRWSVRPLLPASLTWGSCVVHPGSSVTGESGWRPLVGRATAWGELPQARGPAPQARQERREQAHQQHRGDREVAARGPAFEGEIAGEPEGATAAGEQLPQPEQAPHSGQAQADPHKELRQRSHPLVLQCRISAVALAALGPGATAPGPRDRSASPLPEVRASLPIFDLLSAAMALITERLIDESRDNCSSNC